MTDPGNERIEIVPAGAERERFMPLLLLADDSEAQVRSYYQTGDLFSFRGADGATLGMTLAIPWDDGSVELKAVAVDAALHGRGIGQRMLAAVLAELKARGARRMVLGTGTSGIGQLAFYQKAGFRFWRIERDVFTPERGYPEGLEENGIPATGKAVVVHDIILFRIAGDRIAEAWANGDIIGLLMQLGVMPAPAASGTPTPWTEATPAVPAPGSAPAATPAA